MITVMMTMMMSVYLIL